MEKLIFLKEMRLPLGFFIPADSKITASLIDGGIYSLEHTGGGARGCAISGGQNCPLCSPPLPLPPPSPRSSKH